MTATDAGVPNRRCAGGDHGGSSGSGVRFLVRGVLSLGLALVLVDGITAAAHAVFNSHATASTSVGSATLAAPGSVSIGSPLCDRKNSKRYTFSTTLSWPAVPRATGYRVTAVVGGIAQPPVAVATTSHAYSNVVDEKDPARTYRFRVSARVGSWTSANATSTTVTC